eukprot:14367263-Alexandrium_andersonii.AAC.1
MSASLVGSEMCIRDSLTPPEAPRSEGAAEAQRALTPTSPAGPSLVQQAPEVVGDDVLAPPPESGTSVADY